MLGLGGSVCWVIEALVDSLQGVMTMNRLNSAALLARFFDKEMLSKYCQDRLGKSGKGGVNTNND